MIYIYIYICIYIYIYNIYVSYYSILYYIILYYNVLYRNCQSAAAAYYVSKVSKRLKAFGARSEVLATLLGRLPSA